MATLALPALKMLHCKAAGNEQDAGKGLQFCMDIQTPPPPPLLLLKGV